MIRYMGYLFGFILSLQATLLFADEPPRSAAKQCAYNGIVYQDARKLVTDLQSALKKKDKKIVESLIGYPLRLNNTTAAGKTKTTMIANAKDLDRQFNAVFTKNVIDQVLQANVNDIFCNYQGAMIGRGVVWMQADDKKPLKLAVVNGN